MMKGDARSLRIHRYRAHIVCRAISLKFFYGGDNIKKIKILIIMLMVAVCLGGCGSLTAPSDADAIKYAASAFEADVAGAVGELEFQAHLTASAPDAAGDRDVALEFYAPQTLRGVTVYRRDGVVGYGCGGQSFEFEEGGEGWLEIGDILCARGSLTDVRRVEGSSLVEATLVWGDRTCQVTVDSQSGYPTAATQTAPRHITLRVVSFGEK